MSFRILSWEEMGLLELCRGQRVEASLPPKPPVCRPLGSWSLFSTSLVLEKDWFEITGIVQLMLLFPLKKKGLQRACCEICVDRNPLLVMQSPNRGKAFLWLWDQCFLSREKEPS